MKNRTTTVTTGPKKAMKEAVQEGTQESLQKMQRTTSNTTPSRLIQSLLQNAESERLNSIPFKNSSINVFDKKRYDISREFDGQEVPGSLTVRPTLSGGTVETERFDIPGAGTNTSRVRKNAEGQPMRRIVKDKNINQ